MAVASGIGLILNAIGFVQFFVTTSKLEQLRMYSNFGEVAGDPLFWDGAISELMFLLCLIARILEIVSNGDADGNKQIEMVPVKSYNGMKDEDK